MTDPDNPDIPLNPGDPDKATIALIRELHDTLDLEGKKDILRKLSFQGIYVIPGILDNTDI